MRRPLLLCCSLLLLAACATTRVSQAPLSAAAQETLLRELPGFQLQGRSAIKAGADCCGQPSLEWRQKDAESRLKLSGPLGAGSLTLTYSPPLLRVTTGRGEELRDAEARQVLTEQLGFVPPFDALRYWVLGIAAPGEEPTQQSAGANGRLAEMTQLQWRIRYDQWSNVATPSGVVQLPKKLTATRDDLRLTVFVDRWKLQPGN